MSSVSVSVTNDDIVNGGVGAGVDVPGPVTPGQAGHGAIEARMDISDTTPSEQIHDEAGVDHAAEQDSSHVGALDPMLAAVSSSGAVLTTPLPHEQQKQEDQDQDHVQEHNTSQTKERERHSLTLDQRRALRRWANAQSPRPAHKACIDWFYQQYGQMISQSTISHSLSPKYARLDNDSQFSGSRLRFGNWPDVERLVLLWHGQVVASGRSPSNDELAEKAKSIFQQLPRYKGDSPPEFSPGWIHRFKKRYGLLIRRQRRHGTAAAPADDIPYLAEAVPRFMNINQDTSPAAIKDAVLRVVGVEASLGTCARVRDEVMRRIDNNNPNATIPGLTDGEMFGNEDPEIVLQNALNALQQEEADAEAEAREHRTRQDTLPTIASAAMSTPTPAHPVTSATSQFAPATASTPKAGANSADLKLTPITANPNSTAAGSDKPLRCPFCVNQRMLHNVKEAVEHMSTHVVL